ncbi:hypothetical protein BDM02DRAFT_2054258 [Thelephora ganbajun]|uniref:Uncharacterized protein n=1 Tax=Thelephora ganbajun TaxID=370292 RepID=A0ACB6ZGU5_THEGA|nr:hypothetical protein BDM02DRAFT_2054258 [Thelephora ganbajun]
MQSAEKVGFAHTTRLSDNLSALQRSLCSHEAVTKVREGKVQTVPPVANFEERSSLTSVSLFEILQGCQRRVEEN